MSTAPPRLADGSYLEAMGFDSAAATVGELAERALREELSLLVFLNLVLSNEWEHREKGRARTGPRPA